MLAGGFFALVVALMVCVVGFFGARLVAARVAGVAGLGPVFALDQKPWRDVPLGKRAGFAAAGPVGLYLIAALMMVAGYALAGENVVDESSMRVHVRSGSPAQEAGIRDGMRIVAVNGTAIHDWDQLKAEVGKHAGEEITVDLVEPDGTPVSLRPTPDPTGKIGVAPPNDNQRVGVGSALGMGLARPFVVIATMAKGLVRYLSGSEAAVETSGPVGIAHEVGHSASVGFGNMLLLLGALISYFLWVPTLLALIFFPRSRKS